MKKSLCNFWRVFWGWIIIQVLVFFVNDRLFHSWLLNSLARSGMGIFLLIRPIYPPEFERLWSPEKSRRVIRAAAAVSIFLAFFIRTIPA